MTLKEPKECPKCRSIDISYDVCRKCGYTPETNSERLKADNLLKNAVLLVRDIIHTMDLPIGIDFSSSNQEFTIKINITENA